MAHGTDGRARAGEYFACYLLWIVLSALGLWVFFQLQAALTDIARALTTNPYLVNTVLRVGAVVLGLAWLAGVILAESYLRDGVGKGRLWVRARRLLFIEVALLAGAVLLSWLLG